MAERLVECVVREDWEAAYDDRGDRSAVSDKTTRLSSSPICSARVETWGTSSGRILTGGRAGDGPKEDVDAEECGRGGGSPPNSPLATSCSSAEAPYRKVLLLRGRVLENTLRTMPRTAELPEFDLLANWGRGLCGRSRSDGERSDRGEEAIDPSSDWIRRAASENERPRPCRTVTCGGVASCSAIVGGGPSSGKELNGELEPIEERCEPGSSKRRVTLSRFELGTGMGSRLGSP